jgi:pyruvate formate lyase activating enzyme
MVKEAALYEKLNRGQMVRCHICPRRCFIKDGERGFCKVRENRNGILLALNYGQLTAMSVDPIEKKPLFHFWPGTNAFSISSVSCSFTCPWCQNWNISQIELEDMITDEASPDKVANLAKRHRCKTIAYTYNEPIIWFEYVLETSKLAEKQDVFNVLVTNGYATYEMLKELGSHIHATNVDIKAFNPEFYSKYCKAKLEDVLNAAEFMVKLGWHLEITYLIIPTLNDNLEEIRRMSRWVRDSLGVDIPLHLSQFFPMHKMNHLPPTPISKIVQAREIAMEEGLRYVYVGNVPGHEGESTYCPKCGEPVIKRRGFDIIEWNLKEDNLCSRCGEKIPIRGKFVAGDL